MVKALIIGGISLGLLVLQMAVVPQCDWVAIELIILVFGGFFDLAFEVAVAIGMIEGLVSAALSSVVFGYLCGVGCSVLLSRKVLINRSLPSLLSLGLAMTIILVAVRVAAVIVVGRELPGGWEVARGTIQHMLLNLGVLAIWYVVWYRPLHGPRVFMIAE